MAVIGNYNNVCTCTFSVFIQLDQTSPQHRMTGETRHMWYTGGKSYMHEFHVCVEAPPTILSSVSLQIFTSLQPFIWQLKCRVVLFYWQVNDVLSYCVLYLNCELLHYVVGSWDYTIRVWDTRDGTCLDTVYDHGADVYGKTEPWLDY